MQGCVKAFRSAKSCKAALQAARESIVLIKNENDTLPLGNVGKLAVIGPNADSRAGKGNCKLYDFCKYAGSG